jgi:anti-sigma factor RsiW
MMDHNSQLKLQAWLDGELSASEARQVEEQAANDPEARALVAELKAAKAAFGAFGRELELPGSRELFWSKIEREILRQEQPRTAPLPLPFFARLQRFLVPAGAVAAVALAVMFLFRAGHSTLPPGEMELVSPDMGAVTFRSESERMTIVWLYDRNDSSFTDEGASDSLDLE